MIVEGLVLEGDSPPPPVKTKKVDGITNGENRREEQKHPFLPPALSI